MPHRVSCYLNGFTIAAISLALAFVASTGTAVGHTLNEAGSVGGSYSIGSSPSVAGESERAHPFIQMIVNAFVGKTRLTINVRSSADELDLIHNILPDDLGKYDTEELLEGVDIHADFIAKNLEVYDAEGNKLNAKLIEKTDWDIPETGLASGELVDYMLEYTFEYEYDSPPEFLTFRNAVTDANSLKLSEAKLLVKQAGWDAPFSALLKLKEPETFNFDWDREFKRVMTGEELTAWYEDTRVKSLGLTDFGGTYSFIYVTPREIRHEVLVPLANIAQMMTFKQADRYYLTIEEQDAAIPAIEELFSKVSSVTIDGELVQPRFDRMDFAGMNVRDFGKMRERNRVSLANGRVGVIMSFPRRNLPDELSVSWNRFTMTLREVDVVLIEPDETVSKHQFTKYVDDNSVVWTNPGIPPLPEVVEVTVGAEQLNPKPPIWFWAIAAVLAFCSIMMVTAKGTRTIGVLATVAMLGGSAALATNWPSSALEQQQAKSVFTSLHTNLFRAFDYNTEEDVYDALATTVHGPLLKEMYLDMRRSLEVKEQDGAVANIERIEIMEGDLSSEPVGSVALPNPGFSYRCVWELEGTVEHWAHIHRRTNKYEAIFNVRNIDGLWKITEYQPIDEQQGPVVRKVRKFEM